jgi:hypothetical protein
MIIAVPIFLCGCGRRSIAGEPRDSTEDEPPDAAPDEVHAEEGAPDPGETVDVAEDEPEEEAEDWQDAPEEPAIPAATPPMGWNSWNRFGCNIDETMIGQMAEAMVGSGMRNVGFLTVQYFIDIYWSSCHFKTLAKS